MGNLRSLFSYSLICVSAPHNSSKNTVDPQNHIRKSTWEILTSSEANFTRSRRALEDVQVPSLRERKTQLFYIFTKHEYLRPFKKGGIPNKQVSLMNNSISCSLRGPALPLRQQVWCLLAKLNFHFLDHHLQ